VETAHRPPTGGKLKSVSLVARSSLGPTETAAELKFGTYIIAPILLLAVAEEGVGFALLEDGGEDAVAGEDFGVVGEFH
jgi:hypothetical protein